MKNYLKELRSRKFHLPYASEFKEAVQSFRVSEKMLFYLFVILFASSTLFMLWQISDNLMIEVPAYGGSLTEGIVGSPSFLNPLLSVRDADRDLVILVYSGLLKATPEGNLVPDLAESYSISEDGREYDFKLRSNIIFHNGTPITADDVIFTVLKAQDPDVKSPKRANWEGVSVEKISDTEVKFTLKQAYAPFLENTTLGILPKHLWQKVDPEEFSFSQLNIHPIGSGPYEIKTVKKSEDVPTSYELSAFKKYALGQPFIKMLLIKFYANEDELGKAYENGDIESLSAISPQKAGSLVALGGRVEKTPLPRIFGVFFNQNQASVFLNKEVRQALDMGLDKDRIVSEVLGGYGITLDSPIPPGILEEAPRLNEKNSVASSTLNKTEAARAYLEKNGWKWNEKEKVLQKTVKKQTTLLAFSLTTANVPELRATAGIIKEEWEKVGARVDVKIYEPSDLNQNSIRPRKYDALLFGEIVGRDLDLFAFWHSSQRNDPGLNIALYTNLKVDKLLEEARAETDKDKRMEKYQEFEKEVQKEIPAVFIYSPDFIYILPKKVMGADIGNITTPGERFLDINNWYVTVEKKWEFLVKNRPSL